MRVSRQNMIISHGGNHGASRTLRKGSTVMQSDVDAIPKKLQKQLTSTTSKKHTGDRTDRDGPQVGTKKTNAKKAAGPSVPEEKVIENKGGEADAEAKKKAAEEAEAKKKVEAEAAAKKKAEEEKAKSEESKPAPAPRTKRDITLMRKADVEALAAEHGIEVPEGTTGRTSLLREKLVEKLGL